jgi:predicted anti-sigma-YlaC factor YlaD
MSTHEHPYKPGGISCRELVELVTDYLEDALEPAQLEHMEEHLHLCGPCRAYVEQVRTTSRLAAAAEAELERRPDRDALLAAFRDFKRTA